MSTEVEDVLMTDLAARPRITTESRRLSGTAEQSGPTTALNGNIGPGIASSQVDHQPAPSLAFQDAGQIPRSASDFTKNVAGNLDISASKFQEESDDELSLDNTENRSGSHSDPLPYSKLPTGLCYDVRMRYHCELEPLPEEDGYIDGEDPDLHPEDPRRIWAIYRELCHAGLVEDKMSAYGVVRNPLARIEARYASPAEICLIHTASHYRFVERLKGEYLYKLC